MKKDGKHLDKFREEGKGHLKGLVFWGELTGCFRIPHWDWKLEQKGWEFLVIASTGEDNPNYPWEHVSVHRRRREAGEWVKETPTWDEMDRIKGMFWEDDETVMQLHVPHTDKINFHAKCLHLWRPTNVEIPCPPTILV